MSREKSNSGPNLQNSSYVSVYTAKRTITETSRLVQSSLMQSVLESCASLYGIASKEISLAEKWHAKAKAEYHISMTMPFPLCDNVFLELACMSSYSSVLQYLNISSNEQLHK